MPSPLFLLLFSDITLETIFPGGLFRNKNFYCYNEHMSVVVINALSVPEGHGEELEKRFAARLGTVDSEPGFIGFKLLRPTSGETRYFVFTEWETQADFDRWASGRAKDAHGGEHSKPVATNADLLQFSVVLESAKK